MCVIGVTFCGSEANPVSVWTCLACFLRTAWRGEERSLHMRVISMPCHTALFPAPYRPQSQTLHEERMMWAAGSLERESPISSCLFHRMQEADGLNDLRLLDCRGGQQAGAFANPFCKSRKRDRDELATDVRGIARAAEIAGWKDFCVCLCEASQSKRTACRRRWRCTACACLDRGALLGCDGDG